jgi:hypothetical protein
VRLFQYPARAYSRRRRSTADGRPIRPVVGAGRVAPRMPRTKRPTGEIKGSRSSAWGPVSATEARKRVQHLRAEHVNVAAALRLKHRDVRLHPNGITVRKLLKIRRLYRLLMLEAPDLRRR